MLARRPKGWVVVPAVAAGLLGLFGSRTPLAAAADAEIKKDDKVITMFDTGLREDTRVLAVVSAGTELTVSDVQGDFLAVSTTSGGSTYKGWVYAAHVRTPAMLKKLTALGDEFKDYKLWDRAFPALPETVALRRIGRPLPPSDLNVSTSGSVSVQSLIDVSEDRKDRAASSLDAYLRQYMLERNWPRKFDAQSPWQILVAWDRMSVETTNGRPRVQQRGNLFLLNTSTQHLVYQRPIVGEGLTEDELLRDFAKQAGSEYAEIMLRWAAAPTIPSTTSTSSSSSSTTSSSSSSNSSSTPQTKPQPPFGPPFRPPFFGPPR